MLNCFHNFILLLVCVFADFIKEFIHVLFKVLNYFIITLLKTLNCGSAKLHFSGPLACFSVAGAKLYSCFFILWFLGKCEGGVLPGSGRRFCMVLGGSEEQRWDR